MKSRLATFLAGALALWAGTASIALALDQTSTSDARMDAVASRMVRGESYDQATRATLPGSHGTGASTSTPPGCPGWIATIGRRTRLGSRARRTPTPSTHDGRSTSPR